MKTAQEKHKRTRNFDASLDRTDGRWQWIHPQQLTNQPITLLTLHWLLIPFSRKASTFDSRSPRKFNKLRIISRRMWAKREDQGCNNKTILLSCQHRDVYVWKNCTHVEMKFSSRLLECSHLFFFCFLQDLEPCVWHLICSYFAVTYFWRVTHLLGLAAQSIGRRRRYWARNNIECPSMLPTVPTENHAGTGIRYRALHREGSYL